jgi:hypothetical protein
MQVVVDRGCNPDDRKAARVQCVSARLRSISADDDERVCLMVGERVERAALAGSALEFARSRATEESAPQVDDPSHVARAERHQASCHQTGEAVADAERFPSLVQGRSDHGTDGSVHAWRVASARENRDSFHRNPRRGLDDGASACA